MPRNDSGKSLNEKYGVGARHSLYRADGKWYHHLTKFPGALFDENGYIVFPTEEEYLSSPYLNHGQDLNIPGGICSIPRYKSYNQINKQNNIVKENRCSEGDGQKVIQKIRERNPEVKRRAVSKKSSSKLKERCGILVDIIKAISPIYRKDNTNANQKKLIETMVGAAIWYFPQGDECWTGQISINAIKSYHPNAEEKEPKLTKDHEYPRKIAATNLLKMGAELNSEKMFLLYHEQYGKFNYITSKENYTLKRFQKEKVFIEPRKAYEQAGIKLLSISLIELKQIKKKNQGVIEELLKRGKWDRPQIL